MLSFLPVPIRFILSSGMFALNTAFWCLLIYPFAFLRLILPFKFVRNFTAEVMIWIAETWVSINNLNLDVFQNVNWDIELPADISHEKSYLVISNHNSWMDIVIVQKVLNRKIPFLRFFLKKELIYVPLLGLAWWALDFPFMKRYSQDYLKKNPHKKGADMITTRKACEKFKGHPVSVINFLEGTRFSPAKQQKQGSPFKHLLKPKAGGLAFVIGAMGEQFDSILDVTIVYPKGVKSLGQSFAGQLTDVVCRIQKRSIPAEILAGNYLEDLVFKEKTQNWITGMWSEKDQLIEREMNKF